MSLIGQVGPTEDVVVQAEDLLLPASSWLPWHEHDYHQLAWTDAGVLRVQVGDEHWVLPSSRALWIPAGTPHRTGATRSSRLRGVYVDPERCAIRWQQTTLLAVSPLTSALLDHLATPLAPPARRRAEALLPDALHRLTTGGIRFRMPLETRAREVAQRVLADPADDRTVAEHAAESAMSARTLSRLFVGQTGVSFGSWRTTVRLHAALPLLATNIPVATVSRRVGYRTPSAFVAAFRRETGQSPVAYLRAAPG